MLADAGASTTATTTSIAAATPPQAAAPPPPSPTAPPPPTTTTTVAAAATTSASTTTEITANRRRQQQQHQSSSQRQEKQRRPLLFPMRGTRALLAAALARSSAAYGDLAGKRVLVTGSSGGIGAGIAKQLATHGARLMLHYHTRESGALATAEAIRKAGGEVDGILRCDFRSREVSWGEATGRRRRRWPPFPASQNSQAIASMWDLVDDRWDGCDVLVNNAGIVTKLAATDDNTLSMWDETFQVNTHAPLQMSLMAKERGATSIVMVSSIHGSQSVEWMTAYAASKAALDRLTQGLSSEWCVIWLPDLPQPVTRTPRLKPGLLTVWVRDSNRSSPNPSHAPHA